MDELILNGLDEVKWAELQHAYGSAKDVPALLRDLASRDQKLGEKALYEFYGNIWHQGTTYEATRYAVPFLRQILADERSPFRSEILELLVSLAFGHSYHDVHQHLSLFEEEKKKSGFQEKIERELSDVEGAHEAVRAGVPQYLELWDESESELRTRAIYLASLFGKTNPEVAVMRKQKLESETDVAARATLWLGWFYTIPSPVELAFIERAFAQSADDGAAVATWSLELWALSALTMRLSADEAARDVAAQTMIDSMDAGETEQELFARLPHFEDGLAAASLGQMLALGENARRFTPNFIELLRRAPNQYAALGLLESLCPLYFGDFNREKPVQWEFLDESQREIARAIGQTDAVWGDGKIIFANMSEQLRYSGLPDRREQMRALIGGSL